jgi:hypothetical protein
MTNVLICLAGSLLVEQNDVHVGLRLLQEGDACGPTNEITATRGSRSAERVPQRGNQCWLLGWRHDVDGP